MRDTITIGTIAGVIATSVMASYQWVLKLLGFQFIATWETAANICLNSNLIHTPLGYLIGFFFQFTLGASLGVIIAYTLRFTGKDYYLIKGLGIGALVWLGSVGFFMRLLHLQPQGRGDILTNLLTFVDLVIFAPICSYIVARYAKFKVKS